MNRIDDLIAQHCPNGVEYKTFSSVGTFTRGGGPQKKDFQDGGVGCIHYGQIYTHYGISASATNKFISTDIAVKSRKANSGDIVIAVTGENDADLAKGVAWLGEEPVAVSNHTLIFSTSLDPCYVSYYLRSTSFAQAKRRFITGTKVRDLPATAFDKLRIPVPPLEVQREIVRILDQFTALEAALEAELEARRNQYDHYRREAFTFGSDVGVSSLGDLAKNLDSRRKPVTRGARVPGAIPYYGASGIVDCVSEYIFDGDYLLVSEDGANLLARSTPIAFSISGKTWVNNHAHVLEFPTYTERRFVEGYLNSIDLAPYISGATQPKLNKANLNKIPVPSPPMAIKDQIVEVLDKFDALVNDLSIGLPAELAARRKQYEYYRDKLLTFEEAPA